MVAKPGASAEDDGWVLCLVWNGARCASDLVILDASTLNEQAVFELPLAIPTACMAAGCRPADYPCCRRHSRQAKRGRSTAW